MKQISFFLIILWGVCCIDVQSQTIKYEYDASGNCTSRYQLGSKSNSQGMTSSEMLKSSTVDSESGVSQGVLSNSNDSILLFSEDEYSIRIFPNPNNGQFQVEFIGYDNELSKGMITLLSSMGQVITKLTSLNQINHIDLRNVPTGTYILQILIDDKLLIHKVTVEK